MAAEDFPTEEFDAVIMGTGLKECILSGLLSKKKMKVLQIDRNDYYGAECASLNMQQMYSKFEAEGAKVPEDQLGRARDYCVDQSPKFIVGCGELVKMLIYTGVTKYLEFKHVDGSFVYTDYDKKLHEVPVTAKQALATGMLGMFQKVRAQQFLKWVANINESDPSTWDKCDLKNWTMKQVYEYWKCEKEVIMFCGHCVALETSDDYLTNPKMTLPCLKAMQMYAHSLARYKKSPYIYPTYGLGGLPEGFSRLSAVFGGVFMLRAPYDSVKYGPDGKATGVAMSNGKVARIKKDGVIVSDPSYFMKTLDKGAAGGAKIKPTGKVAKWICILKHLPKCLADRKPKEPQGSAQIIIPASQIARKSNIYISVMSSTLNVAPQNYYTATISSNVYTDNPKAELAVAYKMLGPVAKEFFFVTDTFAPANDPRKDHVFVCSSMDATTHFQNATNEVKMIYKMITGEDVDLNANPDDAHNDE